LKANVPKPTSIVEGKILELAHFPNGIFRAQVDRLFHEQSRRIRAVLPEADIQHVGSTAIPDSLTKAILIFRSACQRTSSPGRPSDWEPCTARMRAAFGMIPLLPSKTTRPPRRPVCG
jgi:hypothetical protein